MAAGKGTRMNSTLPKVLHPLRGKTLLDRVLDTAGDIKPSGVIVLTGHGNELVKERIGRRSDRDTIGIIIQEPQLGTGHAVAQCLGILGETQGTVLVLSGDTPRARAETLYRLIEARISAGADVAVLSGILPDPTGYGRILRDEDGEILLIREQKDLLPGQEKIKEVNLGIYSFDAGFLKRELPLLSNENAQGEYYLTDLVQAAAEKGSGAAACRADDPAEALGINTLGELSAMEKAMNRNYLDSLMKSGVRITDPDQTWIEETVAVESDAQILPMCFISGSTRIGSGSKIGPGAVISDSTIGRDVLILPYCVINDSVVEDGAAVGPFAHLRPGSHLGRSSKIGNFVETKKALIGEGSKVSHLSYVGDSELGKGVNIGAGCVTCNYDGYAKYQTVIEDGVFVGSGTMMVAPVTLGKGSLIAAGSTITKDVPPDSLAIGRAQQTIKDGWAAARREKLSAEKIKE